MERKISLGDMIDDFCPKCRLIMNHGVVAMVEEEVKKTRCLTCNNEHNYRHAKDTRRIKDSKNSLFEQVLSSMPGHQKTGSKRKK